MSRYRVTERELLEQVRAKSQFSTQEGRMKDIYTMAFDGDSAESIAKKLKLDVATVKKVLGEMNESTFPFTKRAFKNNEKDNEHTKNALELAKMYGTYDEFKRMKQITAFLDQRGYINKPMYDIQTAITRKYYPRLREEVELKEFNPNFGKDTQAGRTKETHADNKKTKDEDRIKSLENEIQRLKLELENEKNATVKPEPNPDTGEVPLTVGIAHKYLKDKQEKEKVKKEELEEATFSPAMLSQLKSAFGNLKKITPDKATKLNKILDKVNKDGLIDLYKSKIPFVSIGAGGILSKKHNLSPKDISRIISKEEVQEEVELTEYFATVHSDKKQIADFIKKNKSKIDYVDDDAGGNIEFEGKGAHELADKVKAKFGVRVTKESFEPIEDKSLSLDEDKHTLPSMRVPMTVQYTYIRNPQLFLQTLKGTKTGKKLKSVFPRRMGSGEYILKGTGQDHIDFLKTLNQKGIMPKNKILGEELEEDTNKYITEKIKGLENKAKKSGMPYSILKKVYDRGMAAWKGGHRPGATQQQWAFARVNSFVTKSSGTWGKADKDLADKVRASKKEEVELDELQNYSRQLKDPSKEMMVVDKSGKVSVIDKSEFEKYKRQGYMAAEDIGEDGPCWKTHKQVGMKKKNGRMVPNCVPKNEELDKDDKPLVKKVADMLKKASKKHADQSKMLDKAVDESVKVEGGPPAKDPDTGKMGPGSGAHNHGKSSSASPKKTSVSKALLNKDGRPSMGKLKNAIDDVNNSRSMAGDKYGITNIDYREKNGKKYLDIEVQEPEKLKKAMQAKYGKSVKFDIEPDTGNAEVYFEELQEADLTDKQVKMVRKVADKLPKDDFKKRYGKDADNVKFGTATNIVKKKLKIDEYEGARTLVDRLLKQERGDE